MIAPQGTTEMLPLSREELDHETIRFDAAVLETRDIDLFCSSSDWILPADATLMPPRTPWFHRGEHGYLALARGQHHDGWVYLQPLEAAWGLASPLIGKRAAPLAREAVDLLRRHQENWDLLLLSGLQLRSPLFDALVRRLSPHYGLRLGRPSRRHLASLRGGLDGFLSRRSRNLRKSLRAARKRAAAHGITFEACHLDVPERADAHYDRIIAVENRSWKGKEGVGINNGDMYEFYRLMNRRLVARANERVIFARQDERDVAYVLGAVFGQTYRGLQFSYDHEFASFSLGSLCQYWQIRELCAEGYETYDLGAEIEYKRRWGESMMETVLLIVVKH